MEEHVESKPSKKRAEKLQLPLQNISSLAWLGVTLVTLSAFFITFTIPFPRPDNAILNQLLNGVLLAGIPLLALVLFARKDWKTVFRKVGWRQLLQMLGFGLLTAIATLIVAAALHNVIPASNNGAVEAMQNSDNILAAIGHILSTAPQLLGEELITILPMLAITLWLTRTKMNKKLALTIGVLASTAWFAGLHLPTYGWNFLQCFVYIGFARLVLTWAFLRTRNLWVSTGAHIVNDWMLFTIAILTA